MKALTVRKVRNKATYEIAITATKHEDQALPELEHKSVASMLLCLLAQTITDFNRKLGWVHAIPKDEGLYLVELGNDKFTVIKVFTDKTAETLKGDKDAINTVKRYFKLEE